MTDQLAYVMITPYSLYKSRTGGIIGRLLAHAKVELVATRMYVASDAFTDDYQKIVCLKATDEPMRKAWQDYLDRWFRPSNPTGLPPRCMLLLFRGPNAVKHLREDVIGGFTEAPVGDTVRGTYGDFIRDADGTIRHFEPAVITCPDPETNDQHLRILADHALSDGGVFAGQFQYAQPNVQCSLVMLKPDNFYQPSRRPGNIIDTFSRTGLRIVGAKLFHMTVAQGEEFYGPLREIFIKKLKFLVTRTVQDQLGDAFDFPFTPQDAEVLGEHLAERNAVTEFNKIVEYMTGVSPDKVPSDQKATASKTKCLAMLYEGPDAIEKIRTVLGATDPTKAEPGTVRSDFGRDLMRNGAHASDSAENALRERKIVGLAATETGTCDVAEVINNYLKSK